MILKVGAVSRKLNVNPQTLYFYERIGLIPSPNRTKSGYRLYTSKDVERLLFITQAKSLGLTLEEIREILVLKERDRIDCCCVIHDRLQAKADQIQEAIQQLQSFHNDLVSVIEQCNPQIINSKERCQNC